MPDPEWGEAPVAFVVTDNRGLTLEDLTKFSADRLARYKRPKRLVLVERLPARLKRQGSQAEPSRDALDERRLRPGSPGARTAA